MNVKFGSKPRYYGAWRLPGELRVRRVNFRSKALFSVPFFSKLRGLLIGGMYFSVVSGNEFDLNMTKGEGWFGRFTIYRRRHFPQITTHNRRGDAVAAQIMFATRLGSGETKEFALRVSRDSQQKDFVVGTAMGHDRLDVPQGDNAQHVAEDITALGGRSKGPGELPLYARLAERIRDLQLPWEQQNRLWVLLDTAFRVNHPIAIRRRNKLKEIAARRGDIDEFARYAAVLDRACAPRFLGPHGYRLPVGKVPIEQVTAELATVVDELRSLGIEAWISCGALLGFEREKRLLPHDDDIDLSLRVPGNDLDEVAENWKAMMERVDAKTNAFPKNGFIALVLPSGIEVDLFPHWDIGGVVHSYPHVKGELRNEVFFPLAEREWAGSRLPFPAQIEPILVQHYGPNWRTPDPYWKFNWFHSSVRFAPFLKRVKN